MMDRIPRQDARMGQHVRSPGALAYAVDGQGIVLHVREVAASTATIPSTARPALAIGSLVSPLAWEPLQCLLSWGAREGMTAAELLDACRVGACQDRQKIANGRRSTWR